jgi:hypothetical protein
MECDSTLTGAKEAERGRLRYTVGALFMVIGGMPVGLIFFYYSAGCTV